MRAPISASVVAVVFRRLSVLAVMLVSVAHVDAEPILIGGTNQANVFPFGIEGYVGSYQQVYAAEAFSRPISIGSVAFMGDRDAFAAPASSVFSLGFSTTGAGPLSLSSSYAANRGADFRTAFSGEISAAVMPGTFSFVIPLATPYAYDPRRGNLLVDLSIIRNRNGVVVFEAGGNPFVGRVFNDNGNGRATVNGQFGLLTRFSDTAAAPVPEPTTLLLLGGALAGIARRGMQRR
jgi:hypothetical protein